MSDSKVRLVFRKETGLVSWPCSISVPKDDGAREEQTVTARFKILPQSRLDELYAPATHARMTGNPDAALLADALDGFDGLKDETGHAVPDADARASLLAIPYVVDGLARGYFEMLGRRAAKN